MHLPAFCNNWASPATSCRLANNRHGDSWGLGHAARIPGLLGKHSHGCRPAGCDDQCPFALRIQLSKANKHFRIGATFGPVGYEIDLLYLAALLMLALQGPGPLAFDNLLQRRKIRAASGEKKKDSERLQRL